MGLVVFLLVLIGMSLTAATFVISVTRLSNERAVAGTQEKMRKIANAVSGSLTLGGSDGRHYEEDVAALPSLLEDLETKPGVVSACSMNTATRTLQGWCGPYWQTTYQGENAFIDGWGRTLHYDNATRKIWSKGPDGVNNNGTGDDLIQTF